MSRDMVAVVGIILVIGIISALLTFWRAENITLPERVVERGLEAVRRETVSFYAIILPIVVGVIAVAVYRFMQSRWPDSSESAFLMLAGAIALVLTVLAAVVFKMRGFSELLVLHILYAGGFGWLMPQLLNR